ncbi:MAG: tetratricopeptide repeat protein [Actinomycetia bacterium]|nr:tetratricopeptide repeat protein [Actinomycetes bacterium]
MNARIVSWVLAALCGFYLLFIAQRSWVLVNTGEPIAVVLGVALIALPVIGVWVVARELQFGARTAELGRFLAAAGGLPEDDLPRSPGGRIDRAAADVRFAERQRAVEADPEDWGAWFRLAVAYDDAGDRRRARAAMRTAIERYDPP